MSNDRSRKRQTCGVGPRKSYTGKFVAKERRVEVGELEELFQGKGLANIYLIDKNSFASRESKFALLHSHLNGCKFEDT
jgi:hypothetical protein